LGLRVAPVVKVMLVVCIISGLMVPVWMGFVVPEFQKIPDDYESTTTYLGAVQWRGGPGEEFSEPFIQVEAHTERVVEVKGNWVTLQLESIVKNPLTDEIFWQSESNVTVDRYTQQYVDEPAYYSFPLDVEKRDYYNMRHYSYLPRTVFSYEGGETLKGLPVYVFSYRVTGIDASENFPAWVVEGKHPVMDDWGSLWVEPFSGHIVNAKDCWETYFIDPSTGETVYIDNGKIWYAEDTIVKEILAAQELKQASFIQTVLIPFILIVVSLSMVVCTVFSQRRINITRVEEEAARLRTAERLKAVEMVARSIGHDVRNPLSAIRNAAYVLRDAEGRRGGRCWR